MHIEVREGIEWIGFVDWNVRDFHSYNTLRGSTYNSYLVRDEKTALIDTVKAPFVGSLLEDLTELIEAERVSYVVCNHAEPDHAGGLPRVMKALPKAELICDKRCRETLAKEYDTSGWKIRTVSTGETLSLGRHKLRFLETPMVHWPESMFTYVPEERLLFSMDAFGQHYATAERFDDEVPLCTLMEEAKSYYATIVMPYGKQVAAVLKEAARLELEMIAPAHGVIWRSHVPDILRAYENWAAGRPKRKVLVIYDTMWGATGRMAEAILEGAARPGVEAQLIHLRHSDLTRIATAVMDAAAVAFGSATLNQGMMPMAGAVLTYLKGLKPAGKLGLAFGSYGWGRGGPEAVNEALKSMGWDTLQEPIKAQYAPTPEVLDICRRAGSRLADAAESGGKRNPAERVCVDP
ncbi:MAG: FprA family A-type flavoprotein [Planctomycetota bacterium]